MIAAHWLEGRYAGFVLGAYGASLAALAWMTFDTLARAGAVRRSLERLEGEVSPGDKAPAP